MCGSKLKFLSQAAGGVVGAAQRGGGRVQGGAAAYVRDRHTTTQCLT